MKQVMSQIAIQPRIIRMKTAPAYLGMCLREFNERVRPYIREVRIGVQGVGFDREELDRWADDFVEGCAIDKKTRPEDDEPRSGRRHESIGGKKWHAKASAASTSATVSGTSTKSSKVTEFKKALELARGKRQNAS